MWWMAGHTRIDRSDIGWLERKIARQPFRSVVICFIISAVLLTAGFFAHMPFLFFMGAFLLIISILLFFYALLRMAMDNSEKRKSKVFYPKYELTGADDLSGPETVSSWKDRARQEEQDRIIEEIKRKR